MEGNRIVGTITVMHTIVVPFTHGAGDMMATLVPVVVDPLLHYAAERDSRAVRDVAATAHGETIGL